MYFSSNFTAGDRNRTGTVFPQQDFKSCASASSATPADGWRWIRTTEAICSRFTVCPLWPLGNPSISCQDWFTLTMSYYNISIFSMQEVICIFFAESAYISVSTTAPFTSSIVSISSPTICSTDFCISSMFSCSADFLILFISLLRLYISS